MTPTLSRRALWSTRYLVAATALLALPQLASAGQLPQVSGSRIHRSSADDLYISNGKQAGECAFPAVLRLGVGGGLCTGTLVHPQVIAYAAHCGQLKSARLGEKGQGAGLTSFSKVQTNPSFTVNKLDSPTGEPLDWAFAVLDAPVQGVPVVPFASKGELNEIIKTDGAIVIAGYGTQSPEVPAGKNMIWAFNEIGETTDGWIQSGIDKVNACQGDSGGPLLGQLPDGSWRVVGIASSLYGLTMVPAVNCGHEASYNHYSRVRPKMLEWFERSSGIDLTQCYTTSGSVDKGAGCRDFFAGDPKSPKGSWSNNCAGAKKVASPKLYPVGDDTVAPKVEITWPKAKAKFGVGQKVKIRVSASDNEKLQEVSIAIDGNLLQQWKKPPFVAVWETGTAMPYDLRATARDEDGNEAPFFQIRVEVEEGANGVEDDPNAKDEPDESPGEESPSEESPSEESPSEESPSEESPSEESPSEESPSEESPSEESPSEESPSEESPGEETPICSFQSKQGPSSWLLALFGLVLIRRKRPFAGE